MGGELSSGGARVQSLGNEAVIGTDLNGAVIGKTETADAPAIEMPRQPSDLGSLHPQSIEPESAAHVDLSTTSNAFGLKKIDRADLRTYPSLLEVLEKLGDIAGFIQKDTGLPLDLSRVSLDVCPGDEFAIRGQKEAVLRCGGAPNAIEEALDKKHPEHRKIVKTLERVKSQGLGLFLPTEEGILLNGDLLNKGNANHLAEVLYHELIHAAQYQSFPGFYATISKYASVAFELSEKGLKDSPEYREAMDNASACMQFLEGMPTSLQTKNSKVYFPGASDGLGFLYKAWVIAQSVLTREGRSSMIKYVMGTIKYDELQKVSPHLDHVAYRVPELALLAGKSEGEVVINVPGSLAKEEVQQIVTVVERFSTVNSSSKVSCRINLSFDSQESGSRVVDSASILDCHAKISAKLAATQIMRRSAR